MLCDPITCYSIARVCLQCLKLKFDELLSNLAFNFNLRRYTMVCGTGSGGGGSGGGGRGGGGEGTRRRLRVGGVRGCGRRSARPGAPRPSAVYIIDGSHRRRRHRRREPPRPSGGGVPRSGGRREIDAPTRRRCGAQPGAGGGRGQPPVAGHPALFHWRLRRVVRGARRAHACGRALQVDSVLNLG
jgi:hypothetical protein